MLVSEHPLYVKYANREAAGFEAWGTTKHYDEDPLPIEKPY